MTRGFFVTCLRNRQRYSYREIESVLNLMLEPNEHIELNQKLSPSEILKKEQKRRKCIKLRTFKSISNIFFIEEKTKINHANLNDSQFFQTLFSNKKFRYTCKIYFLEYFGQYGDFNPNTFKKNIRDVLKYGSNTFKIFYKQRHSNLEIKEIIFKHILVTVEEIRPDLRVNLDDPDLIINIQVVKSFIGYGFIHRTI